MGKRITEILEDCRVVAENAESDLDIKTGMATYGFTPEDLAGGITLYSDVLGLFGLQSKERQELTEATYKFVEKRETAENSFTRVIKLCRVAFRNTKVLEALLPSIISLSPFDRWSLVAHKLYDSLLGNALAMQQLARFQITAEALQAYQDELNQVKELKNKCDIERGEAQQATKDRNDKLEELRDYCRDIKAIAEIAFEDKPQLLEKLGILVRS